MTIPAPGVSGKRLREALFMAFWLCGWAGGVVIVVVHAFNPSTSTSARVFLAIWLAVWLVGGVFAWQRLVGLLAGMWGEVRVAFDFDQVIQVQRLFGVERARRHRAEDVGGFEYEPSDEKCMMRIGQRRVAVAYGVSTAEGAWLAEQLNAQIERHRSPSREAETARPEQPRDSKISIGVGYRGEDVVTIPALGGRLETVGPLAGFLVIWAAALAFLAVLALRHEIPKDGRAFLVFWTVWWVVGGVFVMKALFFELVAAFGEEQIAFDSSGLTQRIRLLGSERVRHYPVEKVLRFDYVVTRAAYGMTRTSRGDCVMRVGRRRVPIALGIRGEEAVWLVEELNGLLKRRKRE